ncbi:NAD-dependent epimerase/dehydratase family protein [Paenibacillus chitinolyticus]|uniref:NAD-dependent epimerase/dehydratase family protein n=1 Tax=Paenibacillus chitinolyticus TaxID=79263 RepID=UPI002DB5674B|nr:NAD-dependent epimerase/dehydratase family protein [Paenibacillus chitinolyticus]MEC0245086.1 NAD-dependent epimerase/dehydratase family protein [Paenibacillus chitinolyticus]
MNKGICLVTGGAGFIGGHITSMLEKEFEKVIIVDNMHEQIHKSKERPSNLLSTTEFIIGDICNQDMWDQLLLNHKPSVIIHLAAETGTGQSLTESTRHGQVNVVGTTQMLDALIRNDAIPAKILLTSSRAVYGEGKWLHENGSEFYPGQRTREQLENAEWDFTKSTYLPLSNSRNFPMPSSIYGATKLTQEYLISSWCKSYGVDQTILRLQNVYGPGQSLINSYTGIVSLFIRIAKEKKSIPLYEDGKMLRDFVYIGDVANAIYAVLVAEHANGKVFDIGSGYGTTIKEVAEIIASRYGAPIPTVCGMYRNGDVRHASCDITDSIEYLDWAPQVTLQKGLNLLCNWIDKELDKPSLSTV